MHLIPQNYPYAVQAKQGVFDLLEHFKMPDEEGSLAMRKLLAVQKKNHAVQAKQGVVDLLEHLLVSSKGLMKKEAWP